MDFNSRKIYTVGHSNHKIEYFLELIKSQEINCIIDVRSKPISNHNPQYNKESLKDTLKQNNIAYVHFGAEFGARHNDEYLLDEDGVVSFEKVRKTREFQNGIERVDIGLSKGFKIALMCSESNPLECHRFSMISVYLENIGIKVWHILKDKKLISQADLEEQLLNKYRDRILQPSLFEQEHDKDKLLAIAYRFHNKDIGWQSKKLVKLPQS